MAALLKQGYGSTHKVVVGSTVRKMPGKRAETVTMTGRYVLSERQYEHFDRCMNSPASPTEEMLDAHRKLREFATK